MPHVTVAEAMPASRIEASLLALSAFDGPEVEAALAKLAADRDRQVRQAAEDLLHGWGTTE